MNNKVLVVAAHPDDEILGIGGTILKHTENGDEVRCIIVCEGESLRYGKNVGQKQAIHSATDILGVSQVYHLMFPDQALDTYTLTELITPLEKISEEYEPNIVYVQFGGDANRDHKIVFEASNIAFRPVSRWIEKIYSYYTVSSTEWGYPRHFIPDTWSNIEKQLERKIKAFEQYESEIREYPHPRSIQALKNVAAFWGNQCCIEAAEPLITIRNILK